MAWTFEITTGRWYDPTGAYRSTGYAGKGIDKDVPAAENVPNEGPLPENLYHCRGWYNDPAKGPLVTHLDPVGTKPMFNRSGFMIHGDSIEHPGQASEGCAIADHPTRLAMSQSPDQYVNAVASYQQGIAP